MQPLRLQLQSGKYRYLIIDKPFRVTLSENPLPHGLEAAGNEFVYVTPKQIMLAPRYAWNGANYVPDDQFLEGSGVHDGLYQLMELGILPRSNRRIYDRIMRDTARRYGMGKTRAWVYYIGVRWGFPVVELITAIVAYLRNR
jgi:hypothetical protein